MKYRKLGRTELRVSEVAVGCSGYWGNTFFPENKAESVIMQALEQGVNFFDTGHNYCNFNAEPRLGRIVKKILKTRNRSSLILSTKAGTIIPAGSFWPKKGKRYKDFSPDYIEKTCITSLRNLNCDYLDIFQLHGITENEIAEPLLDRLASMKARGMFRYLGVNSHSSNDLLFISNNSDMFDMVLLDYNVLQLDREPIIRRLDEAGVGVVAGTVLGQGHLIKGKIGSIRSLADIWYLARAIINPSGRRLSRNSKRMREVLMSFEGMSGAQAALAYILENKRIASCVFGTTRVENMLELIDVTNKMIDPTYKNRIKEAFREITSSSK